MAKRFRYIAASGLSDVAFPLTPSLSPGESESPRAGHERSNGLRFADGRTTELPLPRGEGRGEGEQTTRPETTSGASKLDCRGPRLAIRESNLLAC